MTMNPQSAEMILSDKDIDVSEYLLSDNDIESKINIRKDYQEIFSKTSHNRIDETERVDEVVEEDLNEQDVVTDITLHKIKPSLCNSYLLSGPNHSAVQIVNKKVFEEISDNKEKNSFKPKHKRSLTDTTKKVPINVLLSAKLNAISALTPVKQI